MRLAFPWLIMWLDSSLSSYSSIVGKKLQHCVVLFNFISGHLNKSNQQSLSSVEFASNVKYDGPFPIRSFFEQNVNAFSSNARTWQSLSARYAAFLPASTFALPSRVNTAKGLGVLRYTVTVSRCLPTRSSLIRYSVPLLTWLISVTALRKLCFILDFLWIKVSLSNRQSYTFTVLCTTDQCTDEMTFYPIVFVGQYWRKSKPFKNNQQWVGSQWNDPKAEPVMFSCDNTHNWRHARKFQITLSIERRLVCLPTTNKEITKLLGVCCQCSQLLSWIMRLE